VHYVHVVIATMGSHSDRVEWCVAAYPEKELADQHRKLAHDDYRQLLKKYDEDYNEDVYHAALYDTHISSGEFYVSSYGIDYTVVDVPIIRHVDEYLELFPTGRLIEKEAGEN
jgi:hypothetical protein